MDNLSGKIWGIGLPRTATSSLAVALTKLGFKTCHSCFYAPRMDEAQAILDTPIYHDYQKLDLRYPGSKFILTLRDPHRWVISFMDTMVPYMKRLQVPGVVPRDYVYDINYRCYSEMFGLRERYLEKELLEVYTRHREHAEIYFRDRPKDLLIMDVDASIDPWGELCAFLDIERVDEAFPHLNTGFSIRAWGRYDGPNKVSSYLP